jgi:hypothetical protein
MIHVPSILDAYAGIYELSSDTRIAITVEGDKLMGTPIGQWKRQFLAESDTVFS